MVENVGIVRHETLGGLLHVLDAGHDGQTEVLHVLAGREVDHRVDVALPLELERRQAHLFRALLPREIQPPRDAGEPFRLDGAENAVAQREDEVARG